jgi:E3 ubiquitin-protein ligase TRIP12
MDAPTVRNLVEIMSSYNDTERRDFLQLYVSVGGSIALLGLIYHPSSVTGAPKLPIGGFRALHPKFTVVKKTPELATRDEVQLTPDQILPSVMTCASVSSGHSNAELHVLF